MGNDEVGDFELEMLRQAALKSLQQNRAKKATRRTTTTTILHRPVPSNRNLIEIQTTDSDPYDPDLVDEIVIAEGSDIDDSDCDEVIEEVLMSSESEEGDGEDSAAVSPTQEQLQEQAESSSDDDALSVASRYSLYEDDELMGNVEIPVKPKKSVETRTRSPLRSKDRRSRSPPRRNRRSRSRSPRKRTFPSRRSRSRERELRKRSNSRDRNGDKFRRKEEPRSRRAPSPLPPRNRDGRRRSTSRGRKKEDKKRKVESPLSHESKTDQELLEKRKRKFQEKHPLDNLEGKTIRFPKQSRSGQEAEEQQQTQTQPEHHKPKPLIPPPSSSSSPPPPNIKINIQQLAEDSPPEPEQEDLRTKLIKKKLKAQKGGEHLGSGRIFSEALKGTRLGKEKEEKPLKRKVSLTY